LRSLRAGGEFEDLTWPASTRTITRTHAGAASSAANASTSTARSAASGSCSAKNTPWRPVVGPVAIQQGF